MAGIDPTTATITFLVGVIVVMTLGSRVRHKTSSLPLPPGPRPLPIVGNLFDMPTKNLPPSLRALNEKYGDLVYLNIMGRPTIVIGGYDAALAILENRSANTSERPRLVMAELVDLMWLFSLQGCTQRWRRLRSTFQEYFHQGAASQYHQVQLRESRKFLNNLIENPHNFNILSRRVINATIMDYVYGIEVTGEDDRYVSIAQRGGAIFSNIVTPGRYLVELFPILKYAPTWLPGAGFQRQAGLWRKEMSDVKHVAYEAVAKTVAGGVSRPSIVSDYVNKKLQNDGSVPAHDEELIKCVVGIAYNAGAETTISSLMAFFLTMLKHPGVQRKAQAEIDAIIGGDRLPEFEDRDSLPYVNAIIKELSRWHGVIPLGIPHRTVDDDEYNGYLIPAGSILVANQWAMSRDPIAYPDPDQFIPERFMQDGKLDMRVRDPYKFQFGFGRRVCPGRQFSNDVLFINIVSILQNFDISPPTGPDGSKIEVKGSIPMDLTLCYPDPFPCRIQPRSPASAVRVRMSLEMN